MEGRLRERREDKRMERRLMERRVQKGRGGYHATSISKPLLFFDAHFSHIGTAIKHPVPDRVKPSFVTFDIRAL